MTKVHTRLLSLGALLAGATLATACFTPPDYAAGAHGAHGEPELPVVPEHPEHGEGEHDEAGEAAAPIVEGIVPGTEGKKLEITAPEIPYEAPFDGNPLSSAAVTKDIQIEEFVLGDPQGEAVAEGKLVEFAFKGYASATGQQVMGSRVAPAKMAVNQATRTRDPIANAIIDGMLGMKPGGKRRVKISASLVDDGAPAGRPAMGDLWIAIEVVSVTDAPVLASAEAFTGEPLSVKKLDNGLEIYDYAAGEGRAAKPGDQVVTHYIGQLVDGTEFDTSHTRPEGLPVIVGRGGVIDGFSKGVEGAKVGMLRKLVIPPELGYGDQDQGKIPPNSTLVFMLQITAVSDAPAMPEMPPGMPSGGPPPTPRPPAGQAPPPAGQ